MKSSDALDYWCICEKSLVILKVRNYFTGQSVLIVRIENKSIYIYNIIVAIQQNNENNRNNTNFKCLKIQECIEFIQN